MNRLFACLLLFLASASYAQIPDGYYDNAEGLAGEELKTALHNIINDHDEYSYNALRDYILRNTDEDPDNSDNVILIYTGRSQSKETFGGGANDWNREHVWAKSHGDFGNSPPAGTDAHHIRPSDASVNSQRGNLDFDMGGTPLTEAPGCKKDSDSFEPRDEVKGDVARMIFYMATRYEGGNGEPDLEVVDYVNTYPAPEHGKLQSLLDWHLVDPPDDFEINRNEVIYSYQNNRNPFIDHPEYVDYIWGDPNSLEEENQIQFSVYPNPVIDAFSLEFNSSSTIELSLYSYLGHLCFQTVVDSGKSTFDMSEYANGLYLLILTDNKQAFSKQYKLIKN